ncbi:DarT ssDNA thymidine ADP-ribosyltransferase family protein [Devosia sp.]|uniref:DarT ssDNA thymidine ADP-ribosyltransferase family protein n=1 Tax=Devosia sp. TaxID=1871048 RepID=UPI0032661C9C
MTINELVIWLEKNNIYFFHFTAAPNLVGIGKYGLLSMHEIRRLGLETLPGGNDVSLGADLACGMDKYVHLCLKRDHPMAYRAEREARIVDLRWLKINPNVLLLPGVMVTDQVSNKNGVVPQLPMALLPKADWQVLYTRTDWNDPAIQERLKGAKKWEVLVPLHVPPEYIRNLNG